LPFLQLQLPLAEETLPTPRSIILTAGQEQVAQPVILAARRYAAFWNTGEPRYAEAALAQNFVDRTLPSGRPQGLKGVARGIEKLSRCHSRSESGN